MLSRQNLFLLCFGVATFRFQDTTFATVFAQVLLTAACIVPIFDDVLAIAISTSVYNKFGYHFLTILQITSTLPIPNYYMGLETKSNRSQVTIPT